MTGLHSTSFAERPRTPKKPRLFVLSAPSGAGKTTLCARLLRDFPALVLSVSSTTRAPRGLEKDGLHYHFLSQEAFKREIDAGHFVEWALVHGNYYGTSRKTFESTWACGKSVLLDIDVQGAESLRTAFPEDALSLFVSPPSLEILEQRLRARGTDSEESIARRMANAREEMAAAPRFHAVVINDDLDHAYAQLRELILPHLGSPHPGSPDGGSQR